MIYHTQSIFISISFVSTVFFSFPLSLVFHKFVLNINHINQLHIIGLYLAIGISVNSVYVIWDAWKQSAFLPQLQGNLHKRMAFTYRRALKFQFLCLITTAFAFMCNGYSNLIAVSSFGWLAFQITLVHYLQMILQYPAYLIVYEKYIKNLEKQLYDYIFCSNFNFRLMIQ